MSEPHPSGTVVVLRDTPKLELLLLQRSPREGKPGPWVFPGGKVEPGDRRSDEPAAADARRAAARETGEEAGLALDPGRLVEISRWITPAISPRRFDTWFFATPAPADPHVRVDGEEIVDHRWIAPAEALRAHDAFALRLAPPTYVTVAWLADFASVADALQILPRRVPPAFHPHIHRLEDGACMLYPGDAGYESQQLEAPGARHRLWAQAGGWRYERTS